MEHDAPEKKSSAPLIVTVFYRKGDENSAKVLDELHSLDETVKHQVVLIDVEDDPAFKDNYQGPVPLVQVGPYHLTFPLSRQDLQVAMLAAMDRSSHLESTHGEAFQKLVVKGRHFSWVDRFSYWLSYHYMVLINILLFLYVGVPFLAPVLMKNGDVLPANIIYAIYKPLCHQFAFRSWFLFGEQAAYPRELAHTSYPITYDQLIGHSFSLTNDQDILQARAFIGNDQLGYKVAICERDVALWGGLLACGLFFSVFRKKMPLLPWYLWLLIGVAPIAIDGASQLTPLFGNLLAWFPARESTPFLRTLTGGLFGILTGWYLFPFIEEAMAETRQVLGRKLAVVKQSVIGS
jgi:uncharacterized membrane protein